ncbi:hypothetical protein CBQ28_17040 [Pseudoalteromonas sp. GCY]|uniref:DUF935 domain-containing protein n=1 Tax=Pseudoalteromonas sp. GCY TaxID=2003316 RepID=UPI000BFEFA4D|nr:DUF935 domain-containing protein [Pseudoalteromonas sp. GCY]PHI35969.1 hypothetical protein CBQ28_17040 [Pseudoalteromonas sp. GCY]QQQ68551.1 DUF935 domain-containing protein [Pseudoalteromonas sp. GCY]
MLVDINGDPLSVNKLDKNQTEDNAQVGMLLRQYAEHPTQGLTPAKLASLLKEAEEGNLAAMADLAKDVEDKDGHISCELGKRRRAVLGFDWKIKPPRNASTAEKRDAEMIAEVLEDATWFTDFKFDLTDAMLKGFCANELQWDYIEKQQLITGYAYRDQNIFKTHPADFNRIMLNDSSDEGEALNPFGWALHIHKSKSGYVHRAGLLSVLAWPFLFKNFSVRDLAEFLEIYGLPVRVGKYPSGATDAEKATLLRAVMAIGHNAGGIIPRGMEIDFQSAANGQADPFESMIRWCELTQSKAVLGGTLTSQADGKTSTNALGSVHQEVKEDITLSDLHQLEQTINRDVIYPMYALNGKSYNGNRRLPRFEFDTSTSDEMRDLAYPLRSLVSLGMQIPKTWVHERLNIPEPSEGEAVLEVPSEPMPGNNTAALNTAVAALNAEYQTRSTQTELDTAIDAITSGDMREEYKATLQPLLDKLNQSEELAAIELAELYPTIDQGQLTEMLTKLIFVSEIWGMIND